MSHVHVYGAFFYLTLSFRIGTEDSQIHEEPEKFYRLGKGISRIAVNEFGNGFSLNFNLETMLGLLRGFLAMEVRYY